MTHQVRPGDDGTDAFNGATANSPWMTMASHDIENPTHALQWGHGEFAVDDNSTAALPKQPSKYLQWGHGEFAVDDVDLSALSHRRIIPPSMGPRRIRRG